MEERVLTVPLREVRKASKSNRADKAVKLVREHLSKHLNTPKEDINIDPSINEALWSKGRKKPPSKLRVRVAKFDDGIVEAEIADVTG